MESHYIIKNKKATSLKNKFKKNELAFLLYVVNLKANETGELFSISL